MRARGNSLELRDRNKHQYGVMASFMCVAEKEEECHFVAEGRALQTIRNDIFLITATASGRSGR